MLLGGPSPFPKPYRQGFVGPLGALGPPWPLGRPEPPRALRFRSPQAVLKNLGHRPAPLEKIKYCFATVLTDLEKFRVPPGPCGKIPPGARGAPQGLRQALK